MKHAVIMMLVVLVGLAVALYLKGPGSFEAALRSSGSTSLKLVPVLALAMLMAGACEVLLSEEIVERWLSESSGWRGIVIAWVAGALTPGGSLVGMPIVASLYKSGVGPSVLVTYLVSLATLSAVRIPIEIGIMGPRLTGMRIAASILLPPIAGLLTRLGMMVLGKI